MPSKKVQVLVLKSIGLESKHVEKLEFMDLRDCDLSGNKIGDTTPVLNFLSKSKYLVNLNLEGNPLCSKPNFKERVSIPEIPPTEQIHFKKFPNIFFSPSPEK
jgi:hypothetical protein